MSLCDDLARLKKRAQDLATPVPCSRCEGGGLLGARTCPRCGGRGCIERDHIEALGALVEDLIEAVAGIAAAASA